MSNYLEYRRQQKLGLVKKEEKKPTPIPKISKKKLAEIAAAKGKPSELSAWYKTIMAKEPQVCWETNEKIDYFMFHASVAHILPKSIFKSVAKHPVNYMILSAQNGSHSKYDRSWEVAATMKVWSYALKVIIKELVPKLNKEERRRLPDIIQQELDPLKTKDHGK